MRRSRWSDLALALYCSSIIIGAGLLTLPLAAARLGFAPLLVAIVLGGAYMAFINRRIAESLHAYLQRVARRMVVGVSVGLAAARGDRGPLRGRLVDEQACIADEARARGSWLLARLTREAGLGAAGRWTILLGMFFYVFFADVGYVLIGSRSLNALAEFVGRSAQPAFVALVAGGMAVMVVAWQLERLCRRPFLLRGALKKVLMMGGAWLAGVGALGLARAAPTLGACVSVSGDDGAVALGVLLFTGAVLAGMYTSATPTASAARRELSDQHTVNVVVASGEMILLGATIALTLGIAFAHGQTTPFYAVAADALSWRALGEWSDLIGLVIFAFVGTGLFNLLSYPSLFETRGGRRSPRLARVVALGTAIPMIVYLAWTLTSAAVLTPDMLASLDAAREYTTIGIARRLAGFDPLGALLVILCGYSVALLAVTSACNGFTESLADQISVALHEQSIGRPTSPGQRLALWLADSAENLRMRLVILVAAVVMALAIERMVQIDISSILAVAGNAGGGLLILILPFFLPAPGQRKTTWSSVMVGVMTAFVLTLLSLNAVNISAVRDLASAVVAGITLLIALSISAMAIWLIRSEPEPNWDVDALAPDFVRGPLAIAREDGDGREGSRRLTRIAERKEE